MENIRNINPVKVDKATIINLEKGKLPPQALDLEEAVLGAMMIDKKGVDEVIDILQPDAFYKDAHKYIFEAIVQLFNDTQPIDLLTVSAQLKKNAKLELAGGDFYLIQLTQKISSSAHIEFHSRIILQKYIQRCLIKISNEIIEDSYDETTDVFDLLDKAESRLYEVTQGNIKRSSETAQSLVIQAKKRIEEIANREGLSGIATGFNDLDKLTSGWQPSDLIIIAARPGMGKCLGKGTKVLMFDGNLKNVEDIVEGDLLMGDDSTPRRVLSIARGREKMYWVHQNKAISYRVNESHILSLKRSRNEGPHKKGDILNITVKDYIEKSDKFKSDYKGYKVAVDFPEKELPLEPYYLGLWLGDGHSYSQRITNTDDEVIAYLQDYADRFECELVTYTQENRTNNYGIVTRNKALSEEFYLNIQQELRALGLINNKHIPQIYLINSKVNRLELLAGIIDADGYYTSEFNCFEIVQKNEEFAKQIKFLCDTLGFRTSLKKKKASIKSTGYEAEAYRLRIFGNIDIVPTKIKRKQAREGKAVVDWKVTGITVEFDKVDDYYGFEIDGNRLFLLEDMTVTHNTAFVLSMARNIAIDFQHPVAVFSLEMSSVQLITRLISSETGLSSEKLRTGKLEKHEWEQLSIKVKDLEKAPLYIDDTPSLSIFDLRAKARRLSSQYGIKLIIIDYLQLMTAGGNSKGAGNREQEISTISRNLKALAKELNVPVIALSQLSRAVETRGSSKRPLLSDLRESGAIEQDADIVSFIYRPEYYKIDEWDDEERSPTQGQAEFIVAKHRNGGLDNIRLKFIGSLGKFDNLDDFSSPFDELPSSMNDSSAAFITKNLPSANEAFGSNMNIGGDDDDVPF
ncbi:replicative DNA helicase [Flavobacterium cyanobacteriorum]|uniref:Replicative DNA helicase n=1 Tax=Flavobacterium cyanobacteriorum TaxID=2022802 RepID=A0A255Z8B3_9FLAO|nr:replicative DNA helicase [Flavobacterium cyanobacteriorum]OYQ37661.1 replicative DNA helicase [Flavobacterium cyanobacteriorum]